MNVLLVDDEPTILKMMKTMLQSVRFQVFDALHAKGALVLAQDNKIDILVCDIVLDKDMDGFTLARSIQTDYPNMAVVFISGFPTDFEDLRHDFGRCALLQKPFQKADLINAIVELAGSGTSQSAPG